MININKITKRQKKPDVMPFASGIALLLILLILNLNVSALNVSALNVSALSVSDTDISDNFSDVNLSNLNNSDNSNSTCKGITVYFFYGEGCPHCAAIEPTVKAICTQCDLSFKSYEVYHNASNLILLRDFEKRYCIPADESGIPVIFVGDSALI